MPQVIENEIDTRYMVQKYVLLGPGKSGKSEFLSKADNHLFIETEAGLNHLKCRKVSCRNFEDIRETVGELIGEWEAFKIKHKINNKYEMSAETKVDFKFQGKQVETLIIDTIDRAVDFAAEDAMDKGRETFKEMEISSLFDMPKGTGWDWTRKRMNGLINKLEELPCAIWLVGHIKTARVEPKDAKPFDKDTVNISGQMGMDLLKWADHTIQLRHKLLGTTEKRILKTIPSQFLECGSRGRMIPDGMEWEEDAILNWKNFRQLFQ